MHLLYLYSIFLFFESFYNGNCTTMSMFKSQCMQCNIFESYANVPLSKLLFPSCATLKCFYMTVIVSKKHFKINSSEKWLLSTTATIYCKVKSKSLLCSQSIGYVRSELFYVLSSESFSADALWGAACVSEEIQHRLT